MSIVEVDKRRGISQAEYDILENQALLADKGTKGTKENPKGNFFVKELEARFRALGSRNANKMPKEIKSKFLHYKQALMDLGDIVCEDGTVLHCDGVAKKR